MIKDDTKGTSLSESAVFQDLGMLNVKRSVDNEMLVFQSEALMKAVIKRLRLEISYSWKEGIRTRELYTQSPVVLQLLDAEEWQDFTLKVTPLSENEIVLSDFSVGGSSINAMLNDTVLTPVGRVIASKTLSYHEDYFDRSITVTKHELSRITESFRASLKVEPASKTSTILNLSLEDASTARAEDLLNTLIQVYNEDAINDKNQIMVNTSNFIAERLVIIEKELGSVDEHIASFKERNRLTDIRSETGMYLQESSQYTKEQLNLLNQKQVAQFIRGYLIDPTHSEDLIPTAISDANVASQINEYNETKLKRDRLVGNSSSKNPVVVDLNNSLNAIRQTIVRAVDNLIAGMDVQIRNVTERDKQNTRRILAVPSQQKQVSTIERQQKIKEELFLYLLNKREENALSQSMTETSARIIDPATGSPDPVSPRKMIILLGTLLISVCIPGGILYMKEILDTTVHNRKDVEARSTIPFLGDIPLKPKDKAHPSNSGDYLVTVREGGRDSVSESFRIIRTNLNFMHSDEGSKVIHLTSFNPGAGKTFTSANLALSIALTGKKAIIVDLDIRRRTLSSLLSEERNSPGITHYLSGKIGDPLSLIRKNIFPDMDNLDVLLAGVIPPNPAELLLGERLLQLITQLREKYQYIIIDSPPANLVADATIINRLCDITLFVIRAGLFDKRQLFELESQYRQSKFRNMALILNAVDYKHAGYGYRYGYRYGYGYGN
jgi:capsular exopolysaccharide synthesis family protein